MASPIVKRSIIIAGQRTSISLEHAFWKGLKEIAARHDTSVQSVVSAVRGGRGPCNLTSALRLFVLEYYQTDGRGKTKGRQIGWGRAESSGGTALESCAGEGSSAIAT
jgi:predicted DNA-binding ribbon-helix-helix protein